MARQPFGRVAPGDPLLIYATEYNGALAAAEDLQNRRRARTPGQTSTVDGDSHIVLARVQIAGGLPKYGIAHLDGVDITPSRLSDFRGRAIMQATMPNAGDTAIGIAIKGGESGSFGQFQTGGISPALVEILDEDHGFVDVKNLDQNMLQSSGSFKVGRILWKQPEADRDITGQAWCVIELDRPRAGPTWAEITAATLESANQWRYTGNIVEQDSSGYGGWTSTGTSVDFRNGIENPNDGAGVEGHGVDVDGSSYPAGFAVQPLAVGAVVPLWRAETGEWWTAVPNADDGTCDPVALTSQVGFASTLRTDKASTSTTFSKVAGWNTATFIDTAAFTWNATQGELTLQPGTYRIAVRPAVTASGGDATMTVRIRESTDGGTATTVGGTIGMPASGTASDAIIQYHMAYLTVASGSTAVVTIEVARDSGTGTATLESDTTLWEVERLG